jgi:hypothetical protein
VRCQRLIDPHFQFEYKIKRLNIKTSHFDYLRSKQFEKNSKKFKFYLPSTYKYRLRLKNLMNSKLVVYFMYHILIFLYNCFLNFIIQKINSKMVKYGMVVLIRREKTDVTDADVAVG